MLTTSITLHRKPKDGTSVTIISKSVTYQISASGTETPTGSWSDKVVATTDTKPYLWTRTIVVYSDTNSTTSYSVSYRGKDGSPGKDAVNINLSPSELVYNADKDGNISSTQFNNNTSTVSATRGGKAVSCSTSIVSKDNCEAAIISSNVIKITKITTESVATGKYVPASAGGVKLKVTVDGTDYYSYLPFRVNTNTFVKTVLETDESFQRKYTEISNKYNTISNELNGKASKDELMEVSSSIEQTARRISLEVSSNAVGRRNLLVNSDFHNQESLYFSSGTRIECTTGKDGINCVHITSSSVNGVYWDGTKSGGMSVVITKGKKYTFSCWVKSSSTSAQFWIRAYSTSDISNASSKTDFYEADDMNISSPNTWEQFTFTIDTSSAVTNYLAVIFCVTSASDAYICQPMMEEGDTYKGWSRSPQDYDYVGGNMLDNTLSLDKSGTLYEVNGTLNTAGFGESTSIYKSFAYKLKGIVDSFSQLPTYGNVYNDTYYVRNDGTCYAYNGSNFENVGNDYYYNILEWRKGKSGDFRPFGLEENKDYVFSFMAKGTGKITAYFYEPYTDVFVESSLGAIYTEVDGYADFQLTNEWRRYWVHWRPSDSLHKYILLRLNRSLKSDGSSPITDCYIAQPKLEEGATMTDFTERKTDLVDKASLKKAGIEITSNMVELYGNQVKVSGAKGGTPVAMFENGMLNSNLINADKIMARQLQTTGSNGQSVSIENGLMRVYGTNGRCNIEFGVNSNGEAILSYYDKDGKWLYDLGPNKLDGVQLKESTLDGEKYVSALSFFETNDFFTLETYINFTVKQVRREYSQRLFGNNLFVNGDQEIANNNAAHIGYKPFERVSSSDVTTLYRYTAPRQSGTIIKDETYGLTTPALAKQADGKYFTSNSKLAINGQLTNLAPAGYYFRQDVKVMTAPYPMPSAEIQPARFPAYSIRYLNINIDSTGSVMSGFNSMMSYLTRTIKMEI